MAIISEVTDEPSASSSAPAPAGSVDDALAPFLDRVSPAGLLEAAVDFLRRKSDLLADGDVRSHLAAAVSAAKAAAEKKRKQEARKAEEGKKEAAPVTAAPPVKAAPPATSAVPEVDMVAADEKSAGEEGSKRST